MKFLSICSGIEAASVAFAPLGWTATGFSEIEPFPSAVLAYHYPDVPNFGDMTAYRTWPISIFLDADVIVGGPPCQSFSVAGRRKGLNDERGNLTLIYTELIDYADAIRIAHGKPPVIVLYENVPGILSDKTNAFGSFLGALAGESDALNPSGRKWTNAGAVLGPQRAIAWRILDAQYFGVAQRRRRVFVVASAREGFRGHEILFEFDGVRRDETTGNVEACLTTSGGGAARIGDTRKQDPVGAVEQQGFRMVAFGEYADNDSASTMKACDYKDVTDLVCVHGTQYPIASSEYAHALGRNGGQENAIIAFSCKDYGGDSTDNLSPTLRAMGHSGSHANGGGQVAVAFEENSRAEVRLENGDGQIVGAEAYGMPGNWIGRKPENGGNSTQFMHEIAPNLTATDRHGVVAFAQNTRDDTYLAFNSRQDPVSGEVAGALAFQPRHYSDRDKMSGSPADVCHTLSATSGQGDSSPHVATTAAIRRLTPIECERLQGFPDNYTQIPWRNKPAEECPDGNRYKALGNSWAVPVVAWIGARIDLENKRLAKIEKANNRKGATAKKVKGSAL